MKKYIILLSLILICSISFGQAIIQRSGVGNTVQDARLSAQYNLFVPRYADTTAALASNSEGIDSCGAIIFTYDVMGLWFRSCSGGKSWVMIDPSGIPSTGNSWIIDGNAGLFTSPVDPQYVGTKTAQGFGFKTSDVARLTIPSTGIARTSDAAYKYLMFDTSGSVHLMAYGDGGSGSSGWGLTGNAGTTAGTNFLGTTDNVDLVFKRNSVESGMIGSTNTSFGFYSSSAGGQNVAIGAQALTANTTGIGNTAIGYKALQSLDGEDYHIGLGNFAGAYSTSGSQELYINSINRGSYENDTTLSIIYGAQSAAGADQRLRLNSRVFADYLPSGVGDKSVRWNSTTKEFTYADTTTGGGSGTVNSGTQYRLGYYATTGTAISEAAAITANRALISDANGVPTHATTTATEIGYVNGVTSAIQTQIGGKANTALSNLSITSINNTAIGAGVNNIKNRTGQIQQGGEITFFGDSYTVGSGASVTYKRWTTQVANAMGATEINYGVAGVTLEDRVPVDYMASPNMVDDTVRIPYKTKYRKMLVIAFGLNDMGQTAAAYTTANYITDYTSVLNNAVAKGWAGNEILLIPPYWIGSAGYAAYAVITGNAAPTVARHESFVAATQTVSQSFGTMYFDIFTDQKNNDTTLLDGDDIHPNDAGYAFIAGDIMQYLGIERPVTALGINISFSAVTNITNTGSDWITSSGVNYGQTGLEQRYTLPSLQNGRLIMTGDSEFGVLGYNSANAQVGYTGMEAGFLLDNTGLVYKVEGGAATSTGVTVATTTLVSLYREGTGFYIQTSTDEGKTWTTITTLTYTSSAVHYIVCDIRGTAAPGVIYNPQFSTGTYNGLPALTSTYVGYGSGSNTLTGSSSMTFDGSHLLVGGTATPVAQFQGYVNDVNGGLQFRADNNAAGITAGGQKYGIFGLMGTTGYGVTGWPSAMVIEGQADGGIYLGAYAGDVKIAAGAASRSIRMTIKGSTGNVGIGETTPTGRLHIAAGQAAASTAPIKLTTGTSNTTAEAGTFEYTTPQLFFTNGGAVRQELFQGQQSRVSTQYDNATTTLGNVTGLTANVAAGKIYRFTAKLFTTSDVAGGVKVAIGGTATATAIRYEGLTTDAGLTTQGRATALGTAVGAVTAVTAAWVTIEGTITVNAAGTLTVQAAANAATGTTSVLTGSTFVITEML